LNDAAVPDAHAARFKSHVDELREPSKSSLVLDRRKQRVPNFVLPYETDFEAEKRQRKTKDWLAHQQGQPKVDTPPIAPDVVPNQGGADESPPVSSRGLRLR
jgi:hypothetical protein